MRFTLKSSKKDPVKTYVSEDGFYKIIYRPSKKTYELKKISLFDILGETLGNFTTLEEAIANAN